MSVEATQAWVDYTLNYHKDKGRTPKCTVVSFLQDQVGREDTNNGRRELTQLDTWRAAYSMEALEFSDYITDPAERDEAQVIFAEDIAADGTNEQVQKAILTCGDKISQGALLVLLTALARLHVNAKAFCNIPRVRAMIPASFDLTSLPCDPEMKVRVGDEVVTLADHPLSGAKEP